MSDLTICRCGLAMYAVEDEAGDWFYVCPECDPGSMRLVRFPDDG